MKPRGKCPRGGRHKVRKKVAGYGSDRKDGSADVRVVLPGRFWLCRKCSGLWMNRILRSPVKMGNTK